MPDAERARILVADDDDAHRMVAAEILREDGHDVLEAVDGLEAVAVYPEFGPDIVVLDVIMPGLDGYQVCARIRALPDGGLLPILMLTGLEDGDAAERSFRAGATDFATKPIQFATFCQRIRFLLRARRTLEALRHSEARLEAAQAIARLGTWEFDQPTGLIRLSREADRLLGGEGVQAGISVESFLARFCADDREGVQGVLAAAARAEFGGGRDCQVQGADGSPAVHVQARTVPLEAGADGFVLGTVQDITERKEVEERIRQLAYYDSLTGLPNRSLFHETLAADIARARRAGRMLAVLFVDLDHFKRVNDSMGHVAGDTLLCEVARRLRSTVRSEDKVGRAGNEDEGIVARLGGDEFILSIGELKRVEDAARVASRILQALKAPVRLGTNEVTVSASVGISLFPQDGETTESLLRNADAALYHAKDYGRHNFQFYDPSMNAAAFQRLWLEGSLRKALEAGEIALYYQPQIRVADGSIAAVEALLRWRHPELGFIEPSQFIPVAEETGLMQEIERWVLIEAAGQLRRMLERGLPEIRMAVNLSSHQFRHRQPLERLDEAFAATGVPPRLIEIEITEGALMDGGEATVALLRDLKARGVRIAIDDFGIGYSSLAYLSRFPIDALKVDRSFVRDLSTERSAAAIVSAIVSLAHNLDLEVVAEGVENVRQRDSLSAQGCDYLQGYLYGRPMPAEEIEELLARAQRLDESPACAPCVVTPHANESGG